jgi:hypothetical protein
MEVNVRAEDSPTDYWISLAHPSIGSWSVICSYDSLKQIAKDLKKQRFIELSKGFPSKKLWKAWKRVDRGGEMKKIAVVILVLFFALLFNTWHKFVMLFYIPLFCSVFH